MNPAPSFRIYPFHELTLAQLYAVLRLRAEVFVVEQACAYQDLDGVDQAALHCLLTAGDELVAYTRLLPPDTAYAGACGIGRVVSSPKFRGCGYGRRVVEDSIAACRKLWPAEDILIHAQSYLLRFYGECGFRAEGEEFLEDGIPHYVMRLAVTAPPPAR